MDILIQVFYSIGKSILITIIVLFLSLIVEKITKLKLFWADFSWEKSKKNVEINAVGASVIFFILNIVVYVYDISKKNIEFHAFSFIIWLVIIFILKKKFYYIHKKYQGIDPNKADDDYS